METEKLSGTSEVNGASDNVVAVENVTTTETPRVYVYVGPSMRGIVNNGSIFRGKKSEILAGIKRNAESRGVADKFPQMCKLLVADSEVSHAKEQLAAGDNGLSRAFKAILGEED